MEAFQSGFGFSRIIRSSAAKAAAAFSMKYESDAFNVHGSSPQYQQVTLNESTSMLTQM